MFLQKQNVSALLLCFVALFYGLASAQAQDNQYGCPGTVFDTSSGMPVSWNIVLSDMSSAQIISLGEEHGTTAHAQIAACVLTFLAEEGKPVLALEHIPAHRQNSITNFLKQEDKTADLFSEELGWDELGWPPISYYAPMLDTAFKKGLKIWATDKPIGRSVDAQKQLERLKVTAPKYGFAGIDIAKAWVPDMMASHCNMINETVAARMAEAQMLRDRIMAFRVIQALTVSNTVVYYAGRGHVRQDRGVPYLISIEDIPRDQIVVGMMAEREEPLSINDIFELGEQFDYVAVAGEAYRSDEDMCAMFERSGGARSN
jgi:uncharacterized iron-regulated protein